MLHLMSNNNIRQRAATAEMALSVKTEAKLSKFEREYTQFTPSSVWGLTVFIFKEAVSLSKIIKSDSKAEKAALNVSIKELAGLYKKQSYTVKPKHTKALVLHHKTDCLRMSTPMLMISLRGQLKRLG